MSAFAVIRLFSLESKRWDSVKRFGLLADSVLTIGVIVLVQPIKPELLLPPLLSGIVMAVSAFIVFLLSRDGLLDRKDGVLLVGVYAVFLVLQGLAA